MRLSLFLVYAFGFLAELVFLLDTVMVSRGSYDDSPSPDRGPGSAIISPWTLTPGRGIVIFTGVVVVIIAWLLELFGAGRTLVFIDSPIIGLIAIVALLAVVAAAALAGLFLPPISEQSLLVVQGLLLAGALLGGKPVLWLPNWVLIVIPIIVAVAVIFGSRAFPAWVKAILYLWYLISLMAIPFQTGETLLINAANLSWSEAYISGMILSFLIIHGLFCARFVPIVLSLIRPQNHGYIEQAMPKLFSDEQVDFGSAVITAGVIGGLLVINYYTKLVELPLALSLGSLLAVHLLSSRTTPRAVPPAADPTLPEEAHAPSAD